MNLNVPKAVRPSPTAVRTPLGAVAGEWSLKLPFMLVADIPSLNDRDHWARKAEKVKAWRLAASQLARAERIPHCDRIQIELHYVPATNQRRDPDNLVAALKPLADGLVDAKVVPDDTLRYVERQFPVIHQARALYPHETRFVLRVLAL